MNTLPDNLALTGSDTAELHELDRWLLQHFGGLDRPDPQDLVDVVTSQATPQQRLLVAAYVRRSVAGRRAWSELLTELATFKKKGGTRTLGPFFDAFPWQLAADLRSASQPLLISEDDLAGICGDPQRETKQTLAAPEVNAQVTLLITPPVQGEHWQLTGWVTQLDGQAAWTAATVSLQPASGPTPRRLLRRTTDAAGLFLFNHLAAAEYTLLIHLTEGVLRVTPLNLPAL